MKITFNSFTMSTYDAYMVETIENKVGFFDDLVKGLIYDTQWMSWMHYGSSFFKRLEKGCIKEIVMSLLGCLYYKKEYKLW